MTPFIGLRRRPPQQAGDALVDDGEREYLADLAQRRQTRGIGGRIDGGIQHQCA